MADDKVKEEETTNEKPTEATEEEAQPSAETTEEVAAPVEQSTEDTYEPLNPAPTEKEAEEESQETQEAEKTNGNVDSAAAENIEVPLDENEAAAQPLTGGDTDVEGGPSEGTSKEKSSAQMQERLIRTLKRREILLPLIGGVTFLIGLILIITGLLIMQNKCDSASSNGHAHTVELGTATNGHDDHNMLIYADNSHMKSHDHENNSTDEEAENIAMGHPAFQSTTFMENGVSYTASLAVDGNTEAKTKKGLCAQTERQSRPGWHVDLEGEHMIKRVKIIIPADCCVGELHDFKVRVGTNETLTANPICKHFMGTALTSSIDMECDQPVNGRYVSIHLLGDDNRPRDRLTLCEVMVFSR